jgi:hypothetical protein
VLNKKGLEVVWFLEKCMIQFLTFNPVKFVDVKLIQPIFFLPLVNTANMVLHLSINVIFKKESNLFFPTTQLEQLWIYWLAVGG